MKSTTLAYASVLALSACFSIAYSQPIHNTDLIDTKKSTQVVRPHIFEKRNSNYHHSGNKKKRSTATKYTTKHASRHFSKRASKHKKSSKHSKKKSSKHSSKKSSSRSTKKSKRASSKKSSTKKSSKVSTKSISSCYKKATFTQYWIPKEGDKDMLNNGKIVTLTGTKNKSLKSDSGSTIAKVSKTTYEVSIYF